MKCILCEEFKVLKEFALAQRRNPDKAVRILRNIHGEDVLMRLIEMQTVYDCTGLGASLDSQ